MSDMSNMFLNGPMDPQTGQPMNAGNGGQPPVNPPVTTAAASPNNGDGYNEQVFNMFIGQNSLCKPRWTEDGKTKLPTGLRALCSSCKVVQGDYNPAIEMVFNSQGNFDGGKITVDLEPSSQTLCKVGDSIDINWVVVVHLVYTGPADKQPVDKSNKLVQDIWRIRLDKPAAKPVTMQDILASWNAAQNT